MADKLSKIVKNMAERILSKNASYEALPIALKVVHLAWNCSGEKEFKEEPAYIYGINEIQPSISSMENEFIMKNVEEIVEKLINYKLKHYPNDERTIFACEYKKGKVTVMWR